MVQERAPQPKRSCRPAKWSSPREQYLYSDPPGITLEKIIEEWRGTKGWGKQSIKQKCTKEGWVEKRKNYWEGVDKRVAVRLELTDADRREEMIKNAGDRHVIVGQKVQYASQYAMSHAVQILQNYEKGENVSLQDAIKAMSKLIPMVSKGVEIERRGLGIADKFVVFSHTREITQRVLIVMRKWIKDSATYENVMMDLKQIEKESRDEIEEILEVK